MAVREGFTRTEASLQVALDSTGVKFEYAPCRPIEVIRFGYIWDAGTVTAPENLDLLLNKRVTVGSATGEVLLGEIAGASGEGQGAGGYGNLDSGEASSRKLDADESLSVEVQVAATAGDGRVFFEYVELPFVAPKLGALTSKTVT